MRWMLILLAAASLAIYAHAIAKTFSRAHGVAPKMKILQAAGAVAAIAHLWSLWRAPALADWSLTGFASLGLYIAALALFFAAKQAMGRSSLTLAFSPDAPERLIDHGVYARVRHPFYTAYALTWLAGVAAAPGPLTILTTLAMGGLYWTAAIQEERKFAGSTLAEQYRAYADRAGMFYPKFVKPLARQAQR